MRRPAVVMFAAAALAGCGNERGTAPDTATPQAPVGTRSTEVGGVRFTSPANWPELPPQGRLAGGIHSRTARVAVWRYPRTEPLPADRDGLLEVRDLLVERVEQRDPTFELRRARLVRRGSADGIELVGEQTIGGARFGVRSNHLFSGGDELVIDAYARERDFERVDATVFRPLARSIRIAP